MNLRQWRVELEEIIEVASLDSELWVSMLSEALKTFPSTGSLNTDITDLDEHRPIFGDLVNDLRKKLLKKQNDPAMLPLECHYLNKTALTSVVGQQPTPVKHFTLKRKPKSAALRAELLQKSTDAANNLKKSTAPTVPVRSRGMPRKMTDTSKYKFINVCYDISWCYFHNVLHLLKFFSTSEGNSEQSSNKWFSIPIPYKHFYV